MSDTVRRANSPTVVLVHGAFADGSSSNGVIRRLQAQGVQATAVANPPRGLPVDSAYPPRPRHRSGTSTVRPLPARRLVRTGR